MNGMKWCLECEKGTHWTKDCWGRGTVAVTTASTWPIIPLPPPYRPSNELCELLGLGPFNAAPLAGKWQKGAS